MAHPLTIPVSGASPSPAADPETDFLAVLGARVREAREGRGLTRKAVSLEAGVSERFLAALEGGEGNASIGLLRRVASALGLQLSDLLNFDCSSANQRIRVLLESLAPARLEEALQRLTEEFGRDQSVRRRRIALIGLRGAGKSTLGQALAKSLGRRFVELDRQIEREAGVKLSEVFMLYGQTGYRKIERRCLDRVLASPEELVLTVGGGIVTEPESYERLLQSCFTVWVRARPEEHMSRVMAQGDMRPMSGRREAMEDLRGILQSREPLYAQADVELNTTGDPVDVSLSKLGQLISNS